MQNYAKYDNFYVHCLFQQMKIYPLLEVGTTYVQNVHRGSPHHNKNHVDWCALRGVVVWRVITPMVRPRTGSINELVNDGLTSLTPRGVLITDPPKSTARRWWFEFILVIHRF